MFLLYLELKPKNGFKLKTGFDFRRSVSVRLKPLFNIVVDRFKKF